MLMKIKNKILLVTFVLVLFISQIYFIAPQSVFAVSTNCNNRFVTLVNPVRGRDLWKDKSLNPIQDQYTTISVYKFPATWLLQYDVLKDAKVLEEIKKFDDSSELGVLLEVSQSSAEAARVIYPHAVPWFNPNAVFLSGYSQSDRRKLIDKLFTDFRESFGYYPKSVGAWWIDSYSLNYLKEKYGIKAAMIVADQKTTDSYGIWGQWWGVPYYPSKVNILTPATSLENKLNVLVIQWAQRDPLLAFGDGTKFSNYSLQANDYTERGKDTLYFKQLVDSYLDCKNPVGQITVGLETGIESVGHIKEYRNQLAVLREISNLKFITMSRMSEEFAKVYPEIPHYAEVSLYDSIWKMTTKDRLNEKFKENISYNAEIPFADYFTADKSHFLDRRLPEKTQQRNLFWFPYFLIASLALLLFSYQRGIIRVWLAGMLFAFGLILRSYYQMGWKIYFGPQLPFLEFFQILLVLGSFFVIWFLSRLKFMGKNPYLLWLIPLIFGLDFLVLSIRVSYISEKYYVGFMRDALNFVGFEVKPFLNITFVKLDFPSYLSSAFLKIDLKYVWDNPISALIFYPMIHVVLGIIFSYLLVKLSPRLQKICIGILIIIFLFYLLGILRADPRQVVPILLQ